MTYEIEYTDGTPQELDADAIADFRHYAKGQFNTLKRLIKNRSISIKDLEHLCAWAGVTGRPFHAMARKYRLADYIEWRTTGALANHTINALGFSDAV